MDFMTHVASLRPVVTGECSIFFFFFLSFFSSEICARFSTLETARLTQNFNTVCSRSQFAVDYKITVLQNYANIRGRPGLDGE